MTEKELEIISKRVDVLFDKEKITEAEAYNVENLADIAYQLTRIANTQVQMANPLIQVDKDGIMRPVPAKPTPDALVDALEPFAKAAEKYMAKLPRPIPEDALDDYVEIEVGFCENARQALATYRKEKTS